jgi:hypothetical protein
LTDNCIIKKERGKDGMPKKHDPREREREDGLPKKHDPINKVSHERGMELSVH